MTAELIPAAQPGVERQRPVPSKGISFLQRYMLRPVMFGTSVTFAHHEMSDIELSQAR